MPTIKVSKDQKQFYEIDDSPQSVDAAKAKGYNFYVDVTKDGAERYTIPIDDIGKAVEKGYQTTQQFQAQQQMKSIEKEAIRQEVGPGKAAALGFAESATFGFADELAGAFNKVTGIGQYGATKQKMELAQEVAKEQEPGAYYTGYIGAMAPGLAAKAPSMAVKEAALTGAGLGALGAAGGSKADLTKGEVSPFIQDILVGGAIGGTLGAAAGKLGEKAKVQAAEAAGLKLPPSEMAQEGEYILQQKLAPVFGARTREGAEQIATRAQQQREQVGKEIGEILRQPEKVLEAKTQQVANEITKITQAAPKAGMTLEQVGQAVGEAIQPLTQLEQTVGTSVDDIISTLSQKATELRQNPAKIPIAKKVEKAVGEFQQYKQAIIEGGRPTMLTPKELNKFKTDYDQRIWGLTKQLKGTEGLQVVREVLKQQVKDKLDALGSTLGSEDLQRLNKQYSKLSTIIDAAVKKSSDSRSPAFSFWDLIGSIVPINQPRILQQAPKAGMIVTPQITGAISEE